MIRKPWPWQPLSSGSRRSPQPALAQQNEQFIPLLVYRTGAYAVNGVPFANGVRGLLRPGQRARRRHQRRQDRRTRSARPAYATDKGVECYERLKGKGPTGAAYVHAAVDRHHLRADREGARRQDPDHHHGLRPGRNSANGAVFTWNFPLLGTYWSRGRHRHPARRQGDGRRSTSSRARRSVSSITTAPMARSRSPRCRCSPRSMASSSRPSPSRIPASSRSRSGSPSARTGPTTCWSGAGV